jgi:hypothetical protein
MQENNGSRRILLTMEILTSLGEVFDKIRQSSTQMEEMSESFYREVYGQNRHEVQADIEKYKQNVQRIKQLNMEMTAKINAWYHFAKNPENNRKLSFPLQFHLKRKELQKTIKKCNEDVYNLTLENRFCKDQLASWEHELGSRAIQKFKQGKEYSQYGKLLAEKEVLLVELKYLLPTLPGICPIELDSSSLGILKEKLKSMVGE